LTYQRESLSDAVDQTYLEIQNRVDSLIKVDTPAVLEEIASLKLTCRKQIANLELLDNELELAKRSLVEQMSVFGSMTIQIEIQQNPASGRPHDSIYQFTTSAGALNWELIS
jgi:hypothetical protein